ncbi:hypothetical protein LX15_005039 [Streptoalloteichus tenebrarius]|uniref:Uncharacterized protein n=1 Tax=Streptoalloteichus tenebrarius (strain ATCC 17920 / DSM 40477 / JCM 4838 / CBS 697.72 / NBRC 16177 / NCIMB 11028 / NRRL B-12390 / A12253. 1 / ISP 5477) TaxID=1933 RepID=A0ABT1I0L1_STRSD|nr:hypothetical protein [Streptoalloteichus tenebrarius]MCP2261318.1 hypothetical protein [Streptoalloteichus tenebrarius]BFF03718.1 hypothetical protein GCM10020241_53930 [Streptoalloteichus tenebrarius]
MRPLEQRYRRVLRLLPRWYREQREQEMVDVLLAGTAEHDGWPERAECVSVAALAVRMRVGGVAAPPRVFAWGQAVRLLAVLGLLAHAVGAVLRLTESDAFYRLRTQQTGSIASAFDLPARPSEWQVFVGQVLPLLSVAALVLLLRGKYVWARVFAIGTLVPSVLDLFWHLSVRNFSPFAWMLDQLPLWVPVLCVLAGFHRDAPPRAGRNWMLLIVSLSVLAALVVSFVGPTVPISDLVVAVIAALSCLVCLGVLWRNSDLEPAWPLALSGLTALLAAAQAPTIYYWLSGSARLGDLVTHESGATVAQLIIPPLTLMALGLPLAICGLRRLPNSERVPTSIA